MTKDYILDPDPLDPTWETALSVWWSVAWRWLLWGLGVGLLAAMVTSIIVGLAGAKSGKFGFLCGMITGFGMGIVAIKQVLQKKEYHDFKLLLFAKKREAPALKDYAPLKLEQ